jgi:diguanylate cyclase (GGDEF)-like protein/PAS domain S-box-containing protein
MFHMTNDSNTEYDLATLVGDDMVCVIDSEQTCLSVNGAFLEAFGKQEKDLIGQRATDPGGQESFAGLIEESLDRALAGEAVDTQRWWDFPCLGFRFVRIRLEPMRDDAGAIRAATVCVRDLTDARLAQEALEESEQRFEDFAEIVSDWLWELDENLRFVYLSARFEEIMGMPMEQILGRRRMELFPEEDQAATATRNHHLDLKQRRPFDDYQFTRILDDGAKRSIRMSGRPIFDDRGRFRGYRGVARDATDARHMESRIAHLASHDLLTGLVNRQEFLQRLQRVVDTTGSDGSEHGLCYVDVDRFRAINDRCGHSAGDQLLIELADLLRAQIRRRDTLARVGGNAFAILMEHCSLTQIERVAEAVRRAVGAFRFARYDQTINVAVTIGVVPIGAHSRSIDQVLKAADHVCYAAKSAGGDRILVYGRPDRGATKERRGRDTAPADH